MCNGMLWQNQRLWVRGSYTSHVAGEGRFATSSYSNHGNFNLFSSNTKEMGFKAQKQNRLLRLEKVHFTSYFRTCTSVSTAQSVSRSSLLSLYGRRTKGRERRKSNSSAKRADSTKRDRWDWDYYVCDTYHICGSLVPSPNDTIVICAQIRLPSLPPICTPAAQAALFAAKRNNTWGTRQLVIKLTVVWHLLQPYL